MSYTVLNDFLQAGCFNSCIGCNLGEDCLACVKSRPASMQIILSGVVASGNVPCVDCASANGSWTISEIEDDCIQTYCQLEGDGPTFCGVTWQWRVEAYGQANSFTSWWYVSLYNPNDEGNVPVVWKIAMSASNCMGTVYGRGGSTLQLNQPSGCDFSGATIALVPSSPKCTADYDFVMTGNWTDNGDCTYTLNGGTGTLAGKPNSNPDNPNAPVPNGHISVLYRATTSVDGCSLGITLAGHTYTAYLGTSHSDPKKFTIDSTTSYSTNTKSTIANEHIIAFCLTANNYLFGQYLNGGNPSLIGNGWWSATKLASDPGAVPDWSINCDASTGVLTVDLSVLGATTATRLGALPFNKVVCPTCVGLCSTCLDHVSSIYYDVTISGVVNGTFTTCAADNNVTTRLYVLFAGSTTTDAPQNSDGAGSNLPCHHEIFASIAEPDRNISLDLSTSGKVIVTLNDGSGTVATFSGSLTGNDCLLSGGDLTLAFISQTGPAMHGCDFSGATVIVRQPFF